MNPSLALSPQPRYEQLEDPLAHLPHTRVIEFPKRHVIYDAPEGPSGLYLVISGRVKVCVPVEDPRDVVIDVYRADDFFGESALLNGSSQNERAVALDRVKLMLWPTEAIQDIMNSRPRLAVALLQTLVQRTLNFRQRIKNLHAGTVERRLADSLRAFAEHGGIPQEDGSVRMSPLTHDLLAQYVGTSREAITLYMTRFRRQGYLNYTRQEMTVYPDALREWLRHAT